jgi:glycosyltransferase involved in cell wall biosynthesis
MRVGVLTTQMPFITGGAERHAANLVTALRERGHEACEISIPFKPYPGRSLVDSLLAARLIDLSNLGYPVDLTVGLKFPAYLIRHPNKVFWVLHQHRQAYDMWESGLSELLHDPDGTAVRALIRAEDRRAIGAQGARVYVNSHNVAARLRRYLDLGSTPLYHPPPNAPLLRAEGYGDFLFAPSRLSPAKRQGLMIEAMVHAPHARLVIAGPPDVPGHDAELRALAEARGVDDRVEILGPIDDATMIRLYAQCRAVVFVPIDEDYGYITLEAMLSSRPVITVTDAGGPLEFIDDGVEGLVVAPEAAALGVAFDRLMQDRGLAERLGAAARAKYDLKGIGWDTVVETLTGEAVQRPLDAGVQAEVTGPVTGVEAPPADPAPSGEAAAQTQVAPVAETPETVVAEPAAAVARGRGR